MKKILIIEDNDQSRYLATTLLEHGGYEVDCAISGPSGIEMARRIHPALILLDIQLPGMDGYDVARALKSDPATRLIPVVALTSYAMAGDRELSLAAGCDGYIEKPIDPEHFVREVEGWLQGHQTEDIS